MGYCPFYSAECPHDDTCEIWDTATTMCGVRRQKSLLELINLKGADSVASEPPVGYHKVYDIYAKKISSDPDKYSIMLGIESEEET